MKRTLNDIMQFDHAIRVKPDGTIEEPTGIYGPEGIEMETLDDDAGSIMEPHEIAYAAEVERQGWDLMRGYSGQYGTTKHDFIMHSSESIGGRMERDIRERPGLYVAIIITCDDGQDAGWAVAFRDES